MNLVQYIAGETIQTNPLDILSGSDGIAYGIRRGTTGLFFLMDMGGMSSIFTQMILYVGVIAIVAGAIGLLFVRKKDMRAELKANIMQRFLILFLAGNVVTFMDLLLAIGKSA